MRTPTALLLCLLLIVAAVTIAPTFAQDTPSQTFVIQAGLGQGNYRAFTPATVQVHSGDTVRWITRGCNVHFADAETPLWLPGENDGVPVLNSNPAALVGNVQSGDSYTGGEANSGLPFGPPQPYFELKFDAVPGSYPYFCDAYSGMTGVVEVVDAATIIPAPADVVAQGLDEAAAALGALQQAAIVAMDAPAQTTEGGVVVTIGMNAGRAQTFDFFPNAVVIETGQSVTWVVPEDGIAELGTGVASLPIGVSRFEGPQPPPPFAFNPGDDTTPPSITITTSAPSVPSGSTVTQETQWGNGWMNPGDSYIVTFAEAGVYRYLNTANGLVSGYVIVQDAS